MELKEILNQNSQQASSNLNYFSKKVEYLNSLEEAINKSLNLLSVITKITKPRNNRISYLQAHYGDVSCALMKTPSTGFYPRIVSLMKEEYKSKQDISRKKRVILMEK
jgi:hypothetical protein